MGAHTRSVRSPESRQRRGGHPAGVAWWQPPKPRRAGPGPDEHSPRHRGRRPAAAPRRTGRERRRLAGRVLGGTVIAALALPLAAFTVGYLLFSVPEPVDAVALRPALVSFADGSELSRLEPAAGPPATVALPRVPAHVRAAVLAAEDRSFYVNPGFDVTGLARAAWSRWQGGSADGATITEQYVRQTADSADGALWGRFRQLVLGVKIAQLRSKDEVLADYLNSAYFGRGAYGVQAAGQAYFGKDVAELSTAEGALLAGLIEAPSRWDPAAYPDRAVRRWNAVLDGMTAEGWLDRGARAATPFPVTLPPRPAADSVPADSRGHVITAVHTELARLGIPERELTRDGLRVTTTLDPRRQEQAVLAARGGLDGQPDVLRSAVVAIDPGTGGVLAYYGGDDGRGEDYARAPRLAGPTFTPFAMLAELLRRSAGSAEPVAAPARPDEVVAAARAAGIGAAPDRAPADLEVTAFDLASGYATLAADGVWRSPHLVASVAAGDGRVLYRAPTAGERRFDPAAARSVTAAMRRVAERDGLALPGGRPVAARTGTAAAAEPGRAADAWTAGFTPGLATTVWMGTDRATPLRTRGGSADRADRSDGPELPGRAWRTFMAEALREQPVEQFPPVDPGTPGADPAATDLAGSTPPTTPSSTPSSTLPTTPTSGPTSTPSERSSEDAASSTTRPTTTSPSTTRSSSTRSTTTDPDDEPEPADATAEGSAPTTGADDTDRSG